MRLLADSEIAVISGAEYTEVTIEAQEVQIYPQPDGTVTLNITQPNGSVASINSGVLMSCTMIGLGVGIMSLAFTAGNGAAAYYIGQLANHGCMAYSTYQGESPPNTNDGDGS